MADIKDDSVNLVVTSPPYPMIEMWDEVFARQNADIREKLHTAPAQAFELMHKELDAAWGECWRVLSQGGFLCVNIGDATRTLNDKFQLYNNHARITAKCQELGFTTLPNIIWRKQTNAPNKFMGSGMLPCGAYVTLEHEWILIFRKGEKRVYKTPEEKHDRMKSSFFWEERNVWFSDIWDIKGTKQKLNAENSRARSAAFPFEIPFRLINMFSQKGDTVLDPFVGTGTTMMAAMVAQRNSVGVEIDSNLESYILANLENVKIDEANGIIKKRYDKHIEFVRQRENLAKKEVKHTNKYLGQKVMTSQESEIELNYLSALVCNKKGDACEVQYEEKSDLAELPFYSAGGLF